MKLYRSKGAIWTGTQADAKTAQGSVNYENIEVPVDKAGLLNFLNTFDVRPGDGSAETPAGSPPVEGSDAAKIETYDQMHAHAVSLGYDSILEALEELERVADELPDNSVPVLNATLPPIIPTTGPATPTLDVVEQILESDGPQFGRFLDAALSRLGELRAGGWDNLRKILSDNPRSRTSLERGLGFLLVSAGEEGK